MSAYYNERDPYAAAWLRNLITAGEIPPGEVDERSIADVRSDDVVGFVQQHYFAGVGGWPLALQLAGWPDDWPVWSGSCPCQPYSAAGKGKGDADERNLWPEFFRLIEACRPPVVFGEQVASSEVVGTSQEAAFVAAVQRGDYAAANRFANRLVKSRSLGSEPRWVDGICRDLESIGYAFRCAVLGAHSVSAPHIRQRLFWVAIASGAEFGRRTESAREHGGTFHAANGGGIGRMADDARHGWRQRRENERGSDSGIRAEGDGSGPTDGCDAGRLAKSDGDELRGLAPARQQPLDEQDGGTGSGLADAGSERIRGRRSAGDSGPSRAREGEGAERERLRADLGNDGDLDRLGDSEGTRRTGSEHGGASCEEAGERTRLLGTSRSGSVDRLANAASVRGAEHEHDARERTEGSASDSADGRGNAWARSRLIPCRDGKLRRISSQSGDEPLAPRIPVALGPPKSELRRMARSARSNRVGRLRGYGNAIVPQVAAVFIRSVMESIQ